MSTKVPNRSDAAWLRSAALALGLMGTALATPVFACGQASAEAAGRRGDEIRAEARKVRGVFRVERIEAPVAAGETASTDIAYSTIYGTVTTARGTVYRTVHQYSGAIILCAATSRPGSDSSGLFYLSRSANDDGRYRLVDYSGDPLAQSRPSEPDR
jgi:hypothetical protein